MHSFLFHLFPISCVLSIFCFFLNLAPETDVPQKEILTLMTLTLNVRTQILSSFVPLLTSSPPLRQIYLVCTTDFLCAVTPHYSASLISSVLIKYRLKAAFLTKKQNQQAISDILLMSDEELPF